jgi:hypothetical protein
MVPDYTVARRLVELIWRREHALESLRQAPQTFWVDKAIHELADEPDAGEPGGPARTPHDAAHPSHPYPSISPKERIAQVERGRRLGNLPKKRSRKRKQVVKEKK